MISPDLDVIMKNIVVKRENKCHQDITIMSKEELKDDLEVRSIEDTLSPPKVHLSNHEQDISMPAVFDLLYTCCAAKTCGLLTVGLLTKPSQMKRVALK